MKKTHLKDNTVLLINKWIVIAAIIITSSLSFLLGYLVGKHIHPSIKDSTSLILSDINPIHKDNDIEFEDKEVSFNNSTALNDDLKNEKNQTYTKIENKVTKSSKRPIKPVTYTVQAGAFKFIHDAIRLKEKLNNKGYTAYIIPSETKRHEKLYKVLIGEFNTRKDAEVLSLKIKNSEGLQTFVTFKTNEEGIR